MDYTVAEVMRFVEENDVKFVKLAFCDAFGRLKNLSILAAELPAAFEKGVAFNTAGIDGFADAKDELYLKPLSETLTVLPWRPHEGCVARLLCNVLNADGSPYAGDTRCLLAAAVKELHKAGYACEIGCSCEFYLFLTDEFGRPTFEPQDRAGYLDASPLDRGENVRRDICLTLEQMGVEPVSSHHERGPGQNEIDFKRSGALNAADDLTTFKSVVKSIAERNGVYASFMPKPLADFDGSGMHIDFTLQKDGKSIVCDKNGCLTDTARAFMSGIKRRARETALFLNPYANSYERAIATLQKHPNKGMTLRTPDPSCNHYLALALLIRAGLEGIMNNSAENDAALLPSDLSEAINAVKDSDFIKQALPAEVSDCYINAKQQEWVLYSQSTESRQTVHNSNFLLI